MNNEDKIRQPICPLLLYFEWDNIDPSKCDYDAETHSCCMRCKTSMKTKEAKNRG